MASYIVQGKLEIIYITLLGLNFNRIFLFFFVASCGDYVAEDYPDHTYLSSYRFVPHQDASMQRKIMENHKKHVYVLGKPLYFHF